MLAGFLESGFHLLNSEDQTLFDRLLEVEDDLLMDWLCNAIQPQDQGMEKIVSKIRTAG